LQIAQALAVLAQAAKHALLEVLRVVLLVAVLLLLVAIHLLTTT
jgi:hypothetical protein